MGLSPSAPPASLPLLLTTCGWRWFTGQLLLLLMAGTLGFALGVIITIKKDGNETTIEVPDGASARIDSEGRVDITLPDGKKTAQRDARDAPIVTEFGPVVERVVNAGGEALDLATFDLRIYLPMERNRDRW